MNRVSCTSVVTARSSVSREARPSRSSYSARTREESLGPPYSEGNTRRVSLRSVIFEISYDPFEKYMRRIIRYPKGHGGGDDVVHFDDRQLDELRGRIHELHNAITRGPADIRRTSNKEIAKKRTRRTVKHQRAIVGASLDVIKERRTQRPEARAAARQAAIKEGKEKKTAEESKKKAEKAKSAAGAARGQVGRIQSKMGAKGAPNKVTAKSR